MESEARPMTIKERMALLDQEKKKAAAVQTSAAPSDLPPTTGKLNVKGFLSNSGAVSPQAPSPTSVSPTARKTWTKVLQSLLARIKDHRLLAETALATVNAWSIEVAR
eukprot:13088-Heterococcus_DN1.PRE.2